MRALVTGIAGFAGSHLAEHLLAAGDEVRGLTRAAAWPANLAGLEDRLSLTAVDLCDESATCAAVTAAAPEVIYHLAARASAAAAHREPVATLRDNVATCATVLAAAAACRPRPRVLLVTSSDIYGLPPGDQPLDEQTPFNPPNAYAVSKVAAHYLGRQRWLSDGLEVVEARPFNHLGPRQGRGFVVPDFASQLAAIARGQAEPHLLVGDLRAGRDFSDVRDIVRGYRLLAVAGRPGEAYHLCRGCSLTIAELLDRLLALSGVTARVEIDPARLRPSPPSVVIGSAAKIEAELGWRPQISLDQTLADALADWRARP
jgi:GDP-4-dehydro-6-deoxy-D-mannose reductase